MAIMIKSWRLKVLEPNTKLKQAKRRKTMEKFYMVTGAAGKPIYAYNCIEFDKAERVAKKAVAEGRDDVYILTATHFIQSPTPELTTQTIQ